MHKPYKKVFFARFALQNRNNWGSNKKYVRLAKINYNIVYCSKPGDAVHPGP